MCGGIEESSLGGVVPTKEELKRCSDMKERQYSVPQIIFHRVSNECERAITSANAELAHRPYKRKV
jgi:hypothetical protein